MSTATAGRLPISTRNARMPLPISTPRSPRKGFANVVEFTTYLVHAQDIPKFMQFRTREFPSLFASGAHPPNPLLVIDRLVREEFLIEVSAVAAL